MKKWFIFISVWGLCSFGYAQTSYEIKRDVDSQTSTTVQDKNANYYKERQFEAIPKSKYSEGVFDYSEDGPAKTYNREEARKIEPKEKKSELSIFGLSPLVFFFILIIVLAAIALLLNVY